MKISREKVAVVTGGASGIGLAIARGLARRNVTVVIADIETDALDAASGTLRGLGGTIASRRTDVADAQSVQHLAAWCTETFGAVHLLFNNAGVSITGPTWEMSLDDWRWVWAVNVGGVVHGIRAFLPLMLEHGQDSYIVNTGSLASFSGHGDHAPYCSSKAAVLSISQSLYSEMRARMTRVGVSVVCPGMVATRIHQSWRNRPQGDLPWSRRESEDAEHMAASEAMQGDGATVDAVADAVFNGISAERFYIFSDAWAGDFVRASMDRAAAARNPIVKTWGLDLRPPAEGKIGGGEAR